MAVKSCKMPNTALVRVKNFKHAVVTMEAREASVATCTELYIPSRVGIHLLKNVLLVPNGSP